MPQSFVIVDDQDPNIQYHNGNWSNLLSFTGGYNNSLSVAVGQDSSFSYSFAGTSIGIWGSIFPGPQQALSTYTIDGQDKINFFPPTNLTAVQDDINFYAADNLSAGQHTITVTAVNATSDAAFAFDYLAFIPVSITTGGPSQTMLTTSLPSSTAAVIIEVSHSKTNVGAIVGGTIGGVAALVIAALAIFFLCYRRRRQGGQAYFYRSADASDLLGNELKPSPFLPKATAIPLESTAGSQTQVGSQTHVRPGSVSSSPHVSEVGGSTYESGTATRTLSYGPAAPGLNYSSPNQARSKAAEAGLLSIAQPATYHADSGVRFNAEGAPSGSGSGSGSGAQAQAEEIPRDVPPMYSEA